MINAAIAQWLKPRHVRAIVDGEGPCRVAFFVDRVRAPWAWIQWFDHWLCFRITGHL